MTGKMVQKYILGLVALAVVGAGVVVISFLVGKEEKPIEPPVVRPVKTMVLQAVGAGGVSSFPGKVKASKEVNLSFQVPGRLNKFPVKQGQKVNEGEMLGQLDQRDFKNNFDAARARAWGAKAYLDRVKVAHSKGAATPMELDQAQAKYEVALAEREVAAKALADTQLTAPFSGVVARTFVENFQDVLAKEAILSLQDVSHIEVVVDVPENVVANVKAGLVEKVVAIFEPLPGREFLLAVKEYATEADPQTQTYSVTFVMPAPQDVNILPGMTATARAYIKSVADPRAPQFSVPVTAIFSTREGERYAWIVDPESMAVRKRSVKIGQLSGSSVRVLEGLKDGEMIVTAGVHYLQEGTKVRRLEEKVEGRTK